jgi:hypothetical protein
MVLTPWEQRVPEEAYHFNPAFCGALIVEFTREFSKAKNGDCPYVLPFCALPIALHPRTRSLLPNSTLTSMYTWMERHSNSLVGYKERASGLREVVQESVRFAMDRSALIVTGAGELATGPSRITFSSKFEQAMTRESASQL